MTIPNGDYLTRSADTGMGLTVTLHHGDGVWSIRVEAPEIGYCEVRQVTAGPGLIAAYWHPFSTFLDLPNPWTTGNDPRLAGVVKYAEALTAEASA